MFWRVFGVLFLAHVEGKKLKSEVELVKLPENGLHSQRGKQQVQLHGHITGFEDLSLEVHIDAHTIPMQTSFKDTHDLIPPLLECGIH